MFPDYAHDEDDEETEDGTEEPWAHVGNGDVNPVRPLEGMLELGATRRSVLMAACPPMFRIPDMADKPSIKVTAEMWKFVNDPATKPAHTDSADQMIRKFVKGTFLSGWMLQYSHFNGADAMLRGTNKVIDGMIEWTLTNMTGDEEGAEQARVVAEMKARYAELLTAHPEIKRNGRMIKMETYVRDDLEISMLLRTYLSAPEGALKRYSWELDFERIGIDRPWILSSTFALIQLITVEQACKSTGEWDHYSSRMWYGGRRLVYSSAGYLSEYIDAQLMLLKSLCELDLQKAQKVHVKQQVSQAIYYAIKDYVPSNTANDLIDEDILRASRGIMLIEEFGGVNATYEQSEIYRLLMGQEIGELRVIVKSNETAAKRIGVTRKEGIFAVKRFGNEDAPRATAAGMATALTSKHDLAGYLDQGNKGSRGGEAAHSVGAHSGGSGQPRFPSRDDIRTEVERRGIGSGRVRFAQQAGDRAGSTSGSKPADFNLPAAAAALPSYNDTDVNSLRERVKFLERFVCRMDTATGGKVSAMVSVEDGDPGGLSDAGSEADEGSSARIQEQVVDVVQEVLEDVKEKMALTATTSQDFDQA